MLTVSSDHSPVEEEGDVAISRDQSAIPCEFCLELFDEHTIAEHQVSIPVCGLCSGFVPGTESQNWYQRITV